MSFRNVASGLKTVSAFEFASSPFNSVGKGGETITVTMRGQTPAAHADAILGHYKFTKADEAKFKELYGFDLRQNLTDAYTRKDNRAAHTSLGKGLYRVEIPIPKELLAQIRAVKSANQPQEPRQTVAEKNGYDQSSLMRARIENSFPNSSVSQPAPMPVNPNATSAERNFYREIDLFKTEATNFGARMVHTADVRADYLKTIKLASDEFVEMAKSGKISYEEGAIRASKLRNVIYETSRLKDSELFRAYAQAVKPKPQPLEWFLDKYADKLYKKTFSSLTSQTERNAVFFETVIAAGRDNAPISKTAPLLGKAGKICLVTTIAISVYNVAAAEDKLDAVGREGSSIGGGI